MGCLAASAPAGGDSHDVCNHGSMASTGSVWPRERWRVRQDGGGPRYEELLRCSVLSAGVYTLVVGASDPQSPHSEDEVYVVLAGRGAIELDGDTEPIAAGSLVYVPSGVRHRFVDIIEELEVVVVFAPPEST